MAYRIPFKVNTSVEFDYKTLTITLGPIRWNPYFECWMATYSDTDGKKVYNLALRAGTNCVAGLSLGIPTLYVLNKYDMKSDPTINGDFYLFIVDEGDVEES